MPLTYVYHRKVTFCYFVNNCLKQKWKSLTTHSFNKYLWTVNHVSVLKTNILIEYINRTFLYYVLSGHFVLFSQ